MRYPQSAAGLGGLLLSLLLASSPAAAQLVRGTVTDAGDQSPVASVDVLLEAEDGERLAQTATDSLGAFQVRAPGPGRFRLTLSRIGYATRSTAPFELGRGEVLTLEISLDAAALQLEPLEVVERKRERTPSLARFYDRAEWVRKSGIGRVYYREDLERVGTIYGLYRMQTMRPSCPMLVLVDNLPVSDPRDLDFLAEMERVEGVEIYRGQTQLPPEYYNQRTCALMLVWTRPGVGNPFSARRLLVAAGLAAAALFFIKLR